MIMVEPINWKRVLESKNFNFVKTQQSLFLIQLEFIINRCDKNLKGGFK